MSQLSCSFSFVSPSDWSSNLAVFLSWNAKLQTSNPDLFTALSKFKQVVSSSIIESSQGDIQELSLSTSPWYNSQSSNKDKQQKILAYAFVPMKVFITHLSVTIVIIPII